jgi:hypothetical protein
MFMTPGLAFFYGRLVRSKNVVGTGQALGLDAHHVEHMVRRTVEGYLKEVEDAAGGG